MKTDISVIEKYMTKNKTSGSFTLIFYIEFRIYTVGAGTLWRTGHPKVQGRGVGKLDVGPSIVRRNGKLNGSRRDGRPKYFVYFDPSPTRLFIISSTTDLTTVLRFILLNSYTKLTILKNAHCRFCVRR